MKFVIPRKYTVDIIADIGRDRLTTVRQLHAIISGQIFKLIGIETGEISLRTGKARKCASFEHK